MNYFWFYFKVTWLCWLHLHYYPLINIKCEPNNLIVINIAYLENLYVLVFSLARIVQLLVLVYAGNRLWHWMLDINNLFVTLNTLVRLTLSCPVLLEREFSYRKSITDGVCIERSDWLFFHLFFINQSQTCRRRQTKLSIRTPSSDIPPVKKPTLDEVAYRVKFGMWYKMCVSSFNAIFIHNIMHWP